MDFFTAFVILGIAGQVRDFIGLKLSKDVL
jgi:hypothetical protein